MNTEVEQMRRKFSLYYIAGTLLMVGLVILYWIFNFPDAKNYPYVRLASGVFGLLSVLSGVGIFAKRKWVRWPLLLLLISMYGVFGTTYDATGATSEIVLLVAFVILPLAAFLFWRAVKKIIFEPA